MSVCQKDSHAGERFAENLVVWVVGGYSFQFLMKELAVAVQDRVPYVIVMLDNAYMGLIRQGGLECGMNYVADIDYDGPDRSTA